MNTNKRNLQSAIRNPHSSRQGILLLVVLSMLTLFLLIGTAFIVSADHYRKTLKTYAKATEASNSTIDQGNLLDEVINQLVRDTNNQNSTLRFHSLLRDMYGNDGILAEIDDVEWATAVTGNGDNFTGGQMLQFLLKSATITDQFGISLNSLNANNNAYNGLVLTFLDGPARGQSVRIVGHIPVQISPNVFNARLRVMSPRKADGSNFVAADFAELNASRILINGRPFNGTGAGYNRLATAGARLNASEAVPDGAGGALQREIALLPNLNSLHDFNSYANAFYLTDQEINYLTSNPDGLSPVELHELQTKWFALRGPTGLGGSDESYDAVDFQNMMLAQLQTNPTETAIPDLDTTVPGEPNRTNPPNSLLYNLRSMVIPSLHRPALLNYWASLPAFKTMPADPVTQSTLGDQVNVSLLRKILLRPNWHDHPNFTGSNPDFALLGNNQDRLTRMIYGPWDVDNDNDGIRDSVWVDFGAPVMENADGRLVKPLAAILVLDMDGRLNLNAHGSEDIANAPPNPVFSSSIAGTGNTTNILPQGQGYGPAEISLGPLMPYEQFDSEGKAYSLNPREQRWKWYKRFTRGANAGRRIVPDMNNTTDIAAVDPRLNFARRQTGKLGQDNGATFVPGDMGFDIAAQLKMQGSPRWANGRLLNSAGAQVLGGYATAPDLYGRYVVGLNDFGQPVSEAISHYNFDNTTRIDQNTPYELDLSLGAARGDSQNAPDGPYTMAEMERILRAYDPDAGALPSRIWKLAGEFKPTATATATTPDLDNLNLWRTTLTTDSYDLPVPSVVVPGWMVETGPDTTTTGDEYVVVMGKPAVGASFADLLEYRIRAAQTPTPWRKADDAANPARITAIQREIKKLLPQDLADGLRLDINRPLGNGRDDDNVGDPGYGVVDEPGEDEGAFWASADSKLDAFTGNDGNNYGQFRDAIDRDGNGTITDAERGDLDGDGSLDLQERVIIHNLRRQTLARDLYVLAMTLVDPLPTAATSETKQARARKLAQWAINVVDYRDPDNIMTAFEYDENPFDGWEVDGNVTHEDGPDNTPGNTDDDNPMQREVVWGAERPELLITETLAWHDRRTENTKLELNPNTPELASQVKKASSPSDGPEIDSDYDQQERPQGAGFVEIYNPWSKNPAANADTHDTLTTPGTDSGVNLAATDLTGNSPVWRLFVPKFGGPAKDTDDPDSANQPLADANADRSVYFAGFDPAVVNAQWGEDGVAYFNDLAANPVPPVRPESYMVVGSGRETFSGSGLYFSPFGARKGEVDETNRGIMLDTNVDPIANPNAATVEVRDGNGNRMGDIDLGANSVFATAEMSAVAIIDQTQLGLAEGEDIPFSFSEPPGGYRVGGSQYKGLTVIDTPLDDQRFTGLGGGGLGGGLANDLNNADGEIGLMLPRAGAGGGLGGAAGTAFAEKARRTLPGFRWVYLQRLANPLLPWNPEQGKTGHDPAMAVNPYMTIDSMGVNVTVFNGIAEKEEVKDPGDPTQDPLEFDNDTNLTGIGGGAIDTFASLQRGRVNLLDTTIPFGEAALADLQQKTSEENEGLSQPVNPTTLPVQVTASLWGPEILSRDGTNNLGLWENRSGMNGDTLHPGSNSYNLKAVPDCTLGFLNEPFRGNSTDPKRTPEQPFPWITWNNRPFANANEIMQVPAFRSSQMLQAFSMRTAATDVEAYDGDVEEFAMSASLTLQKDGPYGHLLNFFRTKEGPTNGKEGIVGLFRLLDYLHVPSPFVKTETWMNPASFGSSDVTSADDPRYLRQPPFNRIAEYRDPGRVNLNTVVSHEVWDGGVLHRELVTPGNPWNINTNNYDMSTGHAGPLFLENTESGLVSSRRGYGTANDSMLRLRTDTPTFFENPFRSADAVDLVPLPTMLLDNSTTPTVRESVHATVLRHDELATGTATNKPPLLASTTSQDYNNSNRNPYFRYQPMARLSSMTTTRSNVYAVWVTIGFFEVEEFDQGIPAHQTILDRFAGVNNATILQAKANPLFERVYPEGYMLGKEAGSDTGDIRRVREFAMIDRSVPVAFEPGQNHNVEKAIRLRRRIE